jgi:hypothetical protein
MQMCINELKLQGKVVKIQGYYKRSRHFQCCIEMKLLTIKPKYLHSFLVHVFKFI